MFDYTNVYDFKSSTTFPKANLTIDEGKNAGEKLYWKKVMIKKFSSEDTKTLQFKHSYCDDTFQKCKMFQQKPYIRSQLICQGVPQLYTAEPGISEDKRKDLMKLCSKKLIPEHFHEFYMKLSQNQSHKD